MLPHGVMKSYAATEDKETRIDERRKFMKMRWGFVCFITLAGAAALGAPPRGSHGPRRCPLAGMKWSDFRKTECGSTASSTPADSAAVGGSSSPTAATKAAPGAIGNAVFPTAVSPKYSNESPGKARMHTCLDQYHANKADNTLGGLKWIAKGGGYYAECNKRLKG